MHEEKSDGEKINVCRKALINPIVFDIFTRGTNYWLSVCVWYSSFQLDICVWLLLDVEHWGILRELFIVTEMVHVAPVKVRALHLRDCRRNVILSDHLNTITCKSVGYRPTFNLWLIYFLCWQVIFSVLVLKVFIQIKCCPIIRYSKVESSEWYQHALLEFCLWVRSFGG